MPTTWSPIWIVTVSSTPSGALMRTPGHARRGVEVNGVGQLGRQGAGGRTIGPPRAGIATAIGRLRAVATAVVTRSRSSPAIAPETRVSGVARGADRSAPRAGADSRLLSAARVRCCIPADADAGQSDRNLRHPAGVGVDAAPAPAASPGTPLGYPSDGISDGYTS